MRWVGSTAAVLFLFVLVGCPGDEPVADSGPDGADAECTIDADCDLGQICNGGACETQPGLPVQGDGDTGGDGDGDVGGDGDGDVGGDGDGDVGGDGDGDVGGDGDGDVGGDGDGDVGGDGDGDVGGDGDGDVGGDGDGDVGGDGDGDVGGDGDGDVGGDGDGDVECVDTDFDGYGPGCAPGPDCDPGDGEVWYGFTGYIDEDGDGATLGTGVPLCTDGSVPEGYRDGPSAELDCNDELAEMAPGNGEVCDGLDNDCDGQADSTEACVCEVRYRNGDLLHPYNFCFQNNVGDPIEVNWNDAKADCEAYGYEIVVMETSSENDWLIAQINGSWWIGLGDGNGILNASEGNYRWADGSAPTYFDWLPGEPNDSGGEDCVEVRGNDGEEGWNDEACGSARAWICEAYPPPT